MHMKFNEEQFKTIILSPKSAIQTVQVLTNLVNPQKKKQKKTYSIVFK